MGQFPLKESDQLGQLVAGHFDKMGMFSHAFYTSSPDRFFFFKTYKDHIKRWRKTETGAEIAANVGSYPSLPRRKRFWHWLWNDDTYKKFHWVIYQRRMKQLKEEEVQLNTFWNNDPLTQFIPKLNLDHINYLPQSCGDLLIELKTVFTQTIELWNKIMFRYFSTKKSDSPGKPSALSEAKDPINASKLLYAKICGFLKLPLGASLGKLKDALIALNAYDGHGRLVKSTEQTRAYLFRMKQHINSYAPQIKYLTETFMRCSINPSDFVSEFSGSDMKAAYQSGSKEADNSWVPFVQKDSEYFLMYAQVFATLYGRNADAKKESDARESKEEDLSETAMKFPSLDELNQKYEHVKTQFDLSSAMPLDASAEDDHYLQVQTIMSQLAINMTLLKQRMGKSISINQRFWFERGDITTVYNKGLEHHGLTTSWLVEHPQKLDVPEDKAKEKSLIKFKDQVQSDLAKYSGGSIRVYRFLYLCGAVDLVPENTTPAQAWREFKQKFLRQVHSSTVNKRYIDSSGKQQEIPADLMQEEENFCDSEFKAMVDSFDFISTMDVKEVDPKYFPLNKDAIVKEGKECALTHIKSRTMVPLITQDRLIVRQLAAKKVQLEAKTAQLEAKTAQDEAKAAELEEKLKLANAEIARREKMLAETEASKLEKENEQFIESTLETKHVPSAQDSETAVSASDVQVGKNASIATVPILPSSPLRESRRLYEGILGPPSVGRSGAGVPTSAVKLPDTATIKPN